MIRSKSKKIGFALALAAFGASFAIAENTPASLDGRWDAVLEGKGVTIPFRLDISGQGPSLKGTFYNGFQPFDGTTSASFQDGKVVLNIDHYLTTITATLKDGQLVDGSLSSNGRGGSTQYQFHAVKHVDTPDNATNVPNIAGSWILPLPKPTAKGEKAFHFVVEQRGSEIAATILRVDGDTGAYTGSFKDGKWVLSHFDGSRPGVLVVTPGPDGTLLVDQSAVRGSRATASSEEASEVAPKSRRASGADPYATGAAASITGAVATPDSRYTADVAAYREDVAIAKGLPLPENYSTHTTARNPNEKLIFNLPDAEGKLVSNDDPRFKDKVVLAIVTGTWCPNCHDEAQYLVQLDKKYRDKGLAIVALDFEEQAQQAGLERERAFVKQYGVQYTYLIAGDPTEMWEKVPQLVNLNTWPATVFVGRDGTIRSVHSGFASPASGKFNEDLKAEFETKIQQLLAEKASSSVAASTSKASVGPGE